MSFWKKLIGAKRSPNADDCREEPNKPAAGSGTQPSVLPQEPSDGTAELLQRVETIQSGSPPKAEDALVFAEASGYAYDFIQGRRLTAIYDDPDMYCSRVANALRLTAQKLLSPDEFARLPALLADSELPHISDEKKRTILLLVLDFAMSVMGMCPDTMPLVLLKADIEHNR